MPDDSPDQLAPPEVTESEASASRKAATIRSRKRGVIEWVAIVAAAVIVSLAMRSYVVQTFYIPSGSMEPTLHIGDRILVSKLSTEFGTIHRGDILVFHPPPHACSENLTVYVKRVIGLPGDTVTSKGNTIYVDGKPLKETWTHYEPVSPAIGKVVVPANHYFMMGDNHPDSCDSRYWGTIPRSAVIGKAFFTIWPLDRIGFL